jgi:hypothetical protein
MLIMPVPPVPHRHNKAANDVLLISYQVYDHQHHCHVLYYSVANHTQITAVYHPLTVKQTCVPAHALTDAFNLRTATLQELLCLQQ